CLPHVSGRRRFVPAGSRQVSGGDTSGSEGGLDPVALARSRHGARGGADRHGSERLCRRRARRKGARVSSRFNRPPAGAPAPVRFPEITRSQPDTGLRVWTIRYGTRPIATATLVVGRGTAHDPASQHGLASLTGDMLDEGAGTLDAIALADAFAKAGTQLAIDVGPDAMTLSTAGLSSAFERALALVGDVVMRPRLAAPDFERVRELRINRLRQLSRPSGRLAVRAYVTALFCWHAYCHRALGTTAALAAMSLDDTRAFWQGHVGPSVATLIVVGDIASEAVTRAAAKVVGA